ncbi:recombinase family protein [Actinomadura rubteroloni]|uniref:recombinase family protein n=1 Tax=Actinomadura rubteroloni TaxID=1926885 RepID=UPI00196AC962|nr:recombinase family protein [Actinomadura rubteroloni]
MVAGRAPWSADALVPALDRLGGVHLPLGGSMYDPSDPMSKMFFNVLAMFVEFEADLLMRTREGIAVARFCGKLKGRAREPTARYRRLPSPN